MLSFDVNRPLGPSCFTSSSELNLFVYFNIGHILSRLDLNSAVKPGVFKFVPLLKDYSHRESVVAKAKSFIDV